MVAVAMAESESGVRIERPNRDKASSKMTRMIVIVLLLASAGLMIIISLGGWAAIEGAKMLQVAYIILYLVLAFFVARWNRGVLPLIAALAIVLLIFAAVSTPAWYARDAEGFDDPALPSGLLGLLTAILVPVQALLIFFAMRGFAQQWNFEIERRDGDRRADPEPAPA